MNDFELLSDKIIVLGGGLEVQDTLGERTKLAMVSEQRADRAGIYYRQHLGSFTTKSAMIICSGGASAIYQGLRDIPAERAEGTLVADHLMRNWDVPSQLIEVESESDTSTLNLLNSIELGYLAPDEFNQEHRLGIVTHANHYKRVKCDLRDLGFSYDASFGIHPKIPDSAPKEFVARRIRSIFFLGVQRGNLGAVRKRSELVTKTFSRSNKVK